MRSSNDKRRSWRDRLRGLADHSRRYRGRTPYEPSYGGGRVEASDPWDRPEDPRDLRRGATEPDYDPRESWDQRYRGQQDDERYERYAPDYDRERSEPSDHYGADRNGFGEPWLLQNRDFGYANRSDRGGGYGGPLGGGMSLDGGR